MAQSDAVPLRLFFDGASSRQGAGAGIVLIAPDGSVLYFREVSD